MPGTEAPILFDLGVLGGTSGTHTTQVFSVTAQQVADLRAGLWYFNLHTGMFGGGEIRGQIQGLTPVIGLGASNPNGGWATVRDGRDGMLQHLNWLHLPWDNYNSMNGEMHPASGDVDGDGLAETVIGLANGGQGYIAIFDDAAHGNVLLQWIQVQWPQYNGMNGAVYPAVGNLDNDPRAEIVAGLGSGAGGWVEIFDDAMTGYAHLMWRQVAFDSYNTANGETHPAIGDVDGDGRGEIILGLGSGGGGWVEVLEDSVGAFAHRDWLRVNWDAYATANGATWPAAGDLDNDGRAEIVLGLGRGTGAASGQGWLQILDDSTMAYGHLMWIQVMWTAYNQADALTFRAVIHHRRLRRSLGLPHGRSLCRGFHIYKLKQTSGGRFINLSCMSRRHSTFVTRVQRRMPAERRLRDMRPLQELTPPRYRSRRPRVLPFLPGRMIVIQAMNAAQGCFDRMGVDVRTCVQDSSPWVPSVRTPHDTVASSGRYAMLGFVRRQLKGIVFVSVRAQVALAAATRQTNATLRFLLDTY